MEMRNHRFDNLCTKKYFKIFSIEFIKRVLLLLTAGAGGSIENMPLVNAK